jgi:hypothetical protein
MAGKEQIELIKTFETACPPNPIFCRQEFLEKLAFFANGPIGKRTVFLMPWLESALAALRALKPAPAGSGSGVPGRPGGFRGAAERYQVADDMKQALNCFRTIPGLAEAVKLVREIGEHPAGVSLE